MRIKFLVCDLHLREFPGTGESQSSYTVVYIRHEEMFSNVFFCSAIFLMGFHLLFNKHPLNIGTVQRTNRFQSHGRKGDGAVFVRLRSKVNFCCYYWAEIFTYFDNLTESDYSGNLFTLRMRSVFALLCLRVRRGTFRRVYLQYALYLWLRALSIRMAVESFLSQ